MAQKSVWILCLPLLFLFAPQGAAEPETNQWNQISQEERGARRVSSFRYASEEGIFLLWGFLGHVTEFYGNPENPLENPPEYDLVFFDPEAGRWQNHLPHEKEREWSQNLPPLHMVASYQGITTGSYRPHLKERNGVLRPDLNMVFDQVTYDSKRNRMIYFTGGRTLAYDLASRKWSLLADLISWETPPPVTGGSLVYDPDRDELLLFGGGHVAESGDRGQVQGYTGTWTFSCASNRWSQVETTRQPPARMSTRMVYDTRRQVMILFGGDAQSQYLADTWIYSPREREWRSSRASSAPPARAGHFTVYDPESGWTMIGGGYNRQDLTDMWAYEARSDRWLKLTPTVPIGWHVTADIAPEERLILLTTATKPPGDTSSCNEIYSVRTTYSLLIEEDSLEDQNFSPRPGQPILKAPLPGNAREISGREGNSQDRRLQSPPVNQWIHLSDPGREAPVRTWGSASFDSKRGRIVYWGGGHCGYGGSDYDFYDLEKNTWIRSPRIPEYPERAWDKGVNPAGVTFGGAPWMRHGRKVYAYDPVSDLIINTKTVVLTAGYEPPLLKNYPETRPRIRPGQEVDFSISTKWVTWTFDPETEQWDLLCPGRPGMDLTVTTSRGVMAVDYDWRQRDTGNRMVDVPFEDLPQKENAVYLLDVAQREWNKLSGGEGPWPQNLYEMTALSFDSRRDQLILHGGGPERNEIWTFDFRKRKWKNQEAGSKGDFPAPVCRRESVYLPSEDVFLTAGYPPGQPDQASWYAYQVAENTWYRLEMAPPPGRRLSDIVSQNRALIYDPERKLVLMVLGQRRAGDIARAEVYALHYNHQEALD